MMTPPFNGWAAMLGCNVKRDSRTTWHRLLRVGGCMIDCFRREEQKRARNKQAAQEGVDDA
eukprot:3151855-Amphidinium_carterae.1